MNKSFNEATHTYEINGTPVPSVTRVLGDLIPCYSASDWHMERGRAVHACAAMIAKGYQFEHDPQIDGQVKALKRFFAEVKPVVHCVELPVFSIRHMYAGTFDICVTLRGKTSRMIMDWKSTIAPSLPYQLAGYAIAHEEDGGDPVATGAGVEIHDDGTYQMSEAYNLHRYKAGFLALLGAYNIRRECGIKEDRK